MHLEVKGRAHTFIAMTLALAFACVPFAAADDTAQSAEAAYLAENHAAMAKMMNDMAVKPTGDVDRDFVAMMVPHHQGAIDMALAMLRYGRNEQLRRLAQEIIVTQQQEIAVMRLAIGESNPGAKDEADHSRAPALQHPSRH